MNITASTPITDLPPGREIQIQMSNLGTRVATIQFQDAGGYHDIPEDKAVSSGDTFTAIVSVGEALDPAINSASLNVSLTAGAGEIVILNYKIIPLT